MGELTGAKSSVERSEMIAPSSITIVIPTLNEEKILIHQLKMLNHQQVSRQEIIIVDGGSDDKTCQIAREFGCRVVSAARGRGQQMNKGAEVTDGEIILFLHADTFLPIDSLKMIRAALLDEKILGGNFRIRFSGETWESRWLTRLYQVLRLGGMCYGDSGLFVRRMVFEEIGGFRDYQLFEDCDIYRRISKRGEFVTLSGVAETSSRRFEGRFIRTFILWALLQGLYWCGVSPNRLATFYRTVR